MKSLNEYIDESISIEKINNNYRTITLVTRENIKCSDLSKEQFVKILSEDLEEANKEYINATKDDVKKMHDTFINSQKKIFTDYAKSKWKTSKKQQEYIDNALKNLKETPDDKTLEFVDVNAWPDKNEIPVDAIIKINNNLKQNVDRCFDVIKDTDIFKDAIGWKIQYIAGINSMLFAFRPHLTFIVSADKQKEIDKERKNLTNSINSFYQSEYWGD